MLDSVVGRGDVGGDSVEYSDGEVGGRSQEAADPSLESGNELPDSSTYVKVTGKALCNVCSVVPKNSQGT